MSSNDLKTITGHGYDWQMKDCYTDDEHVEIQAWCLDKESKPFLLRIQDYPVTCYIELPTFIGRRSKIWTRHDCQDVFNYISFRMSDNRPTGFIFKYMPKLYYYRAFVNKDGEYESKKYPMLWIMFKNLRAMYYCRKILENPIDIRSIGRCKFNVWETGIRLHRKMLTMIGLQYSQWFNAKVTEVDPDFRISQSSEYIVSYKNIEAIDPETTVTWNTNPRIIAYDIETYSSNHNAFPSEYYAKDVIYIITVIFQIVGVRESRKRYAIVYGDTKDIPRAKIIKTNTEMELIDEFENLIQELDPEIITGYNINGFDNKYLKARKELRLRTWNPSVGRIPSDNPEVKKISWSSKGYGDKQMYTFLFAGRICIDLFQIVKRENKFSTYDLNTVSKHFLGRTKHDVPAKEMFRIFKLYTDVSNMHGKEFSRKYIQNIFAELDCPEGWKAGKILSKSLYNRHLVNKICTNKNTVLHPLDFPENGDIKKFWNLSRLLDDDQEDDNDREMKPLYQNLWDTFVLTLQSLQPGESVGILYSSWKYREAVYDMTKVVDYGIEDSELVMDLFETLNTWTALVETTNVCGVPISDLYTRGQQIRGISLVYDLAVKKGIVLDERQMEYIKMAGGYVGDPKPGLYDYVICVDFTSLYPTIIMAHNICWTTLVPPELVDIIPDNMCHIIEWDQDFEVEDEKEETSGNSDSPKKNPGRRKKKEPKFITKHFKYKFVKKEVKEGILPQLVGHLVYERRRVRSQIELTDNPVTKGVLNSRQLALKVTGNSCYGILSAQTSGKLSLVEGGMSVTAIGRQSILKANQIIEEQYGGTVVYGDSVTKDTPILCHLNGKIFYRSIEDLPKSVDYVKNDVNNKECALPLEGLEVWSDKGFTPIKNIIRHKTNKKIYRVLTHTGVVDVTEDHSLLDLNAEKIKPSEISVGDKLLHCDLPKTTKDNIVKDAYPMGLFYGDDSYDCTHGKKHSWAINNTNLDYLEKAKSILKEIYTEYDFKILDTMKSSNVYKLVVLGNVKEFTLRWRELFYDKNKYKKVPDIILNSNIETQQNFFDGYYDADGGKGGYKRFDNKGKIGSAGLYILSNNLGYPVSINTRKDKPQIYRMTLTRNGKKQRIDPRKIKKIEELETTEDYVYDLETENHHFGAGIGRMIVHNTDSTMFQIPDCDTGLKCVTRGPEIADELNKYYPAPMKFEFEKAMRILTICPKKYAAFLYAEKDIKDRKTGEVIYKKGDLITDMYRIFVRGIILARRDNCNWQRTIYRNVLWKILMFRSLEESLNYIIESILQLVTRNVELSELVLVRGLGSNYKSESYMMKIFADELRKIGKPAQPGDRLEYVVVRPYGTDPNQKAKDVLKLGYRMRLVSTFLERLESDKPEPIDVVYYIEKLLKNAVQQIFAIGYKKELDEITKNYEKKKRNVLYTRIDSEPIKMFLSVMKEKQKVINVVNGTNPDAKPKKKRTPRKKIIKKELSPSWQNFIGTNNNTRKVTLKIIE